MGRGVSYEGISLEGKTYDEAVSEINEYANDRLTRYMQWDVLGYKYDYDGSSFSTTWTNPACSQPAFEYDIRGKSCRAVQEAKGS